MPNERRALNVQPRPTHDHADGVASIFAVRHFADGRRSVSRPQALAAVYGEVTEDVSAIRIWGPVGTLPLRFARRHPTLAYLHNTKKLDSARFVRVSCRVLARCSPVLLFANRDSPVQVEPTSVKTVNDETGEKGYVNWEDENMNIGLPVQHNLSPDKIITERVQSV